ncbi:hypothetical protein BGX26_009111, partial [Mortierella sp. AD094]
TVESLLGRLSGPVFSCNTSSVFSSSVGPSVTTSSSSSPSRLRTSSATLNRVMISSLVPTRSPYLVAPSFPLLTPLPSQSCPPLFSPPLSFRSCTTTTLSRLSSQRWLPSSFTLLTSLVSSVLPPALLPSS